MDFLDSCLAGFTAICSAASADRMAAVRRCSASYGVSPGRIKVVPSGTGSWAPPRIVNRLVLTGAGVDMTGGDSAGTSVAAITNGVAASSCLPAPFRRFRGFVPNCSCSQRRIVSRPISIPMSRRPPTSDSADSPACRRRSNSSRWDSSWAVAWFRGCRAWATAWVNVVGRTVANREWVGSDMGADAQRYGWWSGGARGAPQAHSKRQRLDVGVLPSLFLFVFGGYFGGQIGGASVVKSLVSLLTGFLSFSGQVESGLSSVLRFTLSYLQWLFPEWIAVSERGAGC